MEHMLHESQSRCDPSRNYRLSRGYFFVAESAVAEASRLTLPITPDEEQLGADRWVLSGCRLGSADLRSGPLGHWALRHGDS